MGARVSLSALLSTSALSGPVRGSLSAIIAANALSGPVRASLTSIVTANALSGPVRASATYLLSVSSIGYGIEFNTLDSTSELYDIIGWDISLAAEKIPEHNPYRPTIPETVVETLGTEGYDYLKENQEITREQHNITQAGDTTFPHQLMQKAHSKPQYRLGAISKFYHADYGLIHARYVQFNKMTAVVTNCCPVGLIKRKTNLEWQVTNDLDQSDPDLVVGILAPYLMPNDGEYGWAIVDGPNLQPIQNNVSTSEIGEGLSWAATGQLSPTATGRIVARRVNKKPLGDSGAILAGHLHIELESHSKADVAAIVDTQTAGLTDTVNTLADQVDALAGIADADRLVAIERSISQLVAKLAAESSNRTGADSALNDRIDNLDSVTLDQLNTALATLQTWVVTQLTAKQVDIDSIRTLAQAAYDASRLVSTGMITNLQTQINSLLAIIQELDNRPKGRFPLVDGSIPPNLMYLDDGSLIYEETY